MRTTGPSIDSHKAILKRINFFRFEQFEFFRQWRLLRQYAAEQDISLIGDLPIYVSYDSVDVWAHQAIFSLDRDTLRPTKVSGVPPDYFCKTGQRWGNPLYEWHNPDEGVQNELSIGGLLGLLTFLLMLI